MIMIRNYKDSDYTKIRSCLKKAGHFDSIKDTKENLKKKMRASPGSIIVAIEDGKVVGCQYIIFDYFSSFLFRLCVDEKHRHKGIGGLLMREAEKRVKKKGIKKVSILVREPELDHLKKFYLEGRYKPVPFKHQILNRKSKMKEFRRPFLLF